MVCLFLNIDTSNNFAVDSKETNGLLDDIEIVSYKEGKGKEAPENHV